MPIHKNSIIHPSTGHRNTLHNHNTIFHFEPQRWQSSLDVRSIMRKCFYFFYITNWWCLSLIILEKKKKPLLAVSMPRTEGHPNLCKPCRSRLPSSSQRGCWWLDPSQESSSASAAATGKDGGYLHSTGGWKPWMHENWLQFWAPRPKEKLNTGEPGPLSWLGAGSP